LFLLLLLAGDLAFLTLRIINELFDISRSLGVNVDKGHPEFYQYTKFLWICCLLILAHLRLKSRQYFAWLVVFIYFLLDDALRIHQTGGDYISSNYFSFSPPLGLEEWHSG